jgi:AbrB family looped-hinge helix DNA binding protein
MKYYTIYEVVNMETTATTKGQVVIPSSVRRALGIKAGTRFHVELDEKNSQIILRPITREFIHSLRGKFGSPGGVKDLETARARDREREARKLEKLFVKK